MLDLIELIDVSPRVRSYAQTARPVTIRSLDAIHLGTAMTLRHNLTSFITYDKRLLETATAAGLPAGSPA